MGVELQGCGFELQVHRYLVLWTPYIDRIIASDDGETHDTAVRKVLSFFAAAYLDALANQAKPVIFESRAVDGFELPEIYALVLPADRIILFGTADETWAIAAMQTPAM